MERSPSLPRVEPLAQPEQGYRAGVDGLLLAAFAAPVPERFVELGAGVGQVTLALLGASAATCVAIERDAGACALLRANLRAHGLEARCEVLEQEVTRVARERPGTAPLVVCNPPYWAEERSTEPSDPYAIAARRGSVRPFLVAARQLLGRRGRVCFVFPAAELTALFDEAHRVGLWPRRVRLVFTREGEPARRALVECAAGRRGPVAFEPPWLLS